ncbi:MAG: GFA family protein [Alcaligenaceae bacterium]|jgi:hypothetical protein
MHVTGACHCGQIRYEAEIDPAAVSICHCTDCQKITGSAFRVNVPAKKENFRMLAGTPKTYLKTAESGAKRLQAFCQNCGTSIYATTEVDQKVFGLRVGALEQRQQLSPQKQIWCDSAMPWLGNITGLPGAPKQPA